MAPLIGKIALTWYYYAGLACKSTSGDSAMFPKPMITFWGYNDRTSSNLNLLQKLASSCVLKDFSKNRKFYFQGKREQLHITIFMWQYIFMKIFQTNESNQEVL